MQGSRFYKKIVSLALSILLIGFGIFAWNNKWEIHDRWTARSYIETADSAEVLANLDLTSKGTLVYRASNTEVDDKDNFRTRCPVEEYEQANVLGCYSNRRIYVLKVDEPRLKGVEEVTAAHELLHAKFERMGGHERAKLRGEIDKLRGLVTDEEVNKLVDSYKTALGEGEDLYNEIFAIYGTQLEDVGPELEEIYSEYFKNRKSIVERYKDYSSEFSSIQSRVEEYDRRLLELKNEKDTLEAEAGALSDELNREKVELDNLSSGDSIEQYQASAEEYNRKVEIYNSKVERIREIIAEYNELVEVRNAEALSAKSLTDKLNANVREI